MSLADELAKQQEHEEQEREMARPANAEYTGDPCQFCGRIRVYLRKDGWLICEKCEQFQDSFA